MPVVIAGPLPNSVRKYRVLRNLRLIDLASPLGISASNLSYRERGKTPFSEQELTLCARILRVTKASLREPDPNVPQFPRKETRSRE